MQVQVFDDSSFSGFVDDMQYSNFVPLLLGAAGVGVGNVIGNKQAKKINTRVDQLNAEATKIKLENEARLKANAEETRLYEEKIKQAKELKAKLEEQIDKPISIVPTDVPLAPQQDVAKQVSGNPLASIPKPILIGGGVILALVVIILVIRK